MSVAKTLLASITLALCTSTSAQGYITTPKGMLEREGGFYAQLFGSWSNARFQQVDGTHVGSAGYTITKIAFRLDNRHYYTRSAKGRIWSNIRLDVSETNFSKLGKTFSHNVIGRQTRVFDSKWTWPTQRGAPLLRPASWGGSGGKLSFPFRTPWIYSGTQAMLMDYRFSGGVLEDGSPWALGTVYFFLDGAPTRGYAIASPVLLPPTLNGCRDTMWGNRGSKEYSAATFAAAYIIDGIVTDTLQLRFMLESRFTALKSPVVHAIGLGGTAGLDVGARCQRLYVDLGKPVVFVIRLGPFAGMSWTVPWRPVLADLSLYAQAAWADSQAGAFSLTVASKVTLPSSPAPAPSSQQFRTVHDSQNPAATVGLGPWMDSRLFPITRYTVR